MVPSEDNSAQLTPMVRQFLAQKIHNLLDALDPYVDGTMGPVSTRHVQQYVAALKLLGQCYAVFSPSRDAVTVKVPASPELMQERVLAALAALEGRSSG